MKRFNTVDEYIQSAVYFQPELIHLRQILLTTKLVETVKWGSPCYTHNEKTVVGLGAFKSYVGLWFFQGALLTDKEQHLINAQEGRTKAMRQWRFASANDIKPRAIKAYVKEAIELVEQGREIRPNRRQPVVVPPELKKALSENRRAKSAFSRLTKGRQREYTRYIAEAKRAETKAKRLEKIIPLIESGAGLNDRYRSS